MHRCNPNATTRDVNVDCHVALPKSPFHGIFCRMHPFPQSRLARRVAAAGLLAACERDATAMCRRRRRRCGVAKPLTQKRHRAIWRRPATLAAVNTVDLVARIPGFVQDDQVQGRHDREEGHVAVRDRAGALQGQRSIRRKPPRTPPRPSLKSQAEFDRQADLSSGRFPPRPITTRRWRSATPTRPISNRPRPIPRSPRSITAIPRWRRRSTAW